MKSISGLCALACGFFLLSCEKSPVAPLGDEFRLPTTTDGATLTGNELLFWPVDTREGQEGVKGVFAVDADGGDIHRLSWVGTASYVSPTLLADGRVAAIRETDYATSTPPDVVIFEWGLETPLHVQFPYATEWIGHVVGLRGPNANRLIYVLADGLHVADLTTGQTSPVVRRDIPSKPTALADGRIAVVSVCNGEINRCIDIVRTDGTVDVTVPLPDSLPVPPLNSASVAPVVFGLSDGRLLLAHRAGDHDVQFYVAAPEPQPTWTRVTGFPTQYPPQPPEFREWGVQVLGGDRLAYVHEDHYYETSANFNVMVGRITGSTITGVTPIFQSRIDSRDIGNSQVALFYLEWVIYD